MNESQATSLAARHRPASGAVFARAAGAAALALLAALGACGQKGPLTLPVADGSAAAPARAPAKRASMPADRASQAPLPPLSSTN
jgi:predicted small lipoprotein YifL